MNTLHSINQITSNPDIRNGQPCIINTGIRVANIAIARVYHQQDADGIAEWYDLSLAQVYAGLSYYYEHKTQMDTVIREQIKQAHDMKEKRIGSRHSPLLG